ARGVRGEGLARVHSAHAREAVVVGGARAVVFPPAEPDETAVAQLAHELAAHIAGGGQVPGTTGLRLRIAGPVVGWVAAQVVAVAAVGAGAVELDVGRTYAGAHAVSNAAVVARFAGRHVAREDVVLTRVARGNQPPD